MSNIPLRCACGALRGEVRLGPGERGVRAVCLCDDCQAFAYFLERPEVLDDNGGTQVFQVTPAQLSFTRGAEQLRCMRLGPKGLLRWYSACCRTPVGNTLPSPRVPHVGVVTALVDSADQSLDTLLGPVRARVNARFGHGKLPRDAHPSAPPGLIVRTMGRLLAGFITGKYAPSPLFDLKRGKPLVEPLVLTLAEREALRERASRPPRE